MELSHFCRYLGALLGSRAREINNLSFLVGVPERFWSIAGGFVDPTDEDFDQLAAFLDISGDHLRGVYEGDPLPMNNGHIATGFRCGGG